MVIAYPGLSDTNLSSALVRFRTARHPSTSGRKCHAKDQAFPSAGTSQDNRPVERSHSLMVVLFFLLSFSTLKNANSMGCYSWQLHFFSSQFRSTNARVGNLRNLLKMLSNSIRILFNNR